jgi:hypothetical protein
MSTDLEADLRREFDAVGAPSGLTFSPESVLRQGKRTIIRRRITAGGSAAIAVVLAVTGASLLTRPEDRAAPRPATRTATTGIVLGATAHMWGGQSEVRFNRDPRVKNNVSFSVLGKDGKRYELGVASTGRPGQAPTAVWKSAMVEGHPITIGLFPGSMFGGLTVAFVKDAPYGVASEVLKGTGFSMFYIDYRVGPNEKEAAQPTEIASISWSGPNGIVDGLQGDKRLTGRVLNLDKSASVKVVLRADDGGRTTVSGQVMVQIAGGGFTFSSPTVATTNPSGAAFVTGRQPIVASSQSDPLSQVGPPIAAGILPPGSSGIGVILTTDAVARPIVVSKRLGDGRVIFALRVASTNAADPGKDSIKAVTWGNADGSQGRMDVTQKQT